MILMTKTVSIVVWQFIKYSVLEMEMNFLLRMGN